ncbi:MAG: septum formation protein Maf [Cytophagales bacterium]|nr:septum formation protein Maf [Cytophagales bacterium]
MNKIILASSSPRRAELLKALGVDFTIKKYDFVESFPQDLDRYQVSVFLAQNKAQQVDNLKEGELVITSDTIVLLDNEVLGKPKDRNDAIATLQKLSNRSHEVITGVCLKSIDQELCFSSITKVHFKKLSEQDILHYVEHHNPYDKAGSYGIQDWIGLIGIDYIEGSYFNVMGLPTDKLYEKLKEFKERQ